MLKKYPLTVYTTEMTSHNKYCIEVEINKQVPFRKFRSFDSILNTILLKALEVNNYPQGNYNISLLLCDDDYITELNAQYRNKKYPTNVLSFEGGDIMESTFFLGDIAISIPRIRAEAIEQNKTFRTHFIHMFVHGVLHVMGFDHMTQQEADAMEALEDDILNCVANISV